MRRRALVVGIAWFAGAGLATAVWATQSGGGEDPAALARTLRYQMIRDGVRLAEVGAAAQRSQTLSADQMISLSGKYEAELDTLVAHAEQLRVNAYHARDIIRLAYIDDRMAQLTSLVRVVKPYFGALESTRSDLLSLRSRFNLIQQAIERARVLVSEMEQCLGENIENISADQLPAESAHGNETDPTRPQNPDPTLERPAEASTYR